MVKLGCQIPRMFHTNHLLRDTITTDYRKVAGLVIQHGDKWYTASDDTSAYYTDPILGFARTETLLNLIGKKFKRKEDNKLRREYEWASWNRLKSLQLELLTKKLETKGYIALFLTKYIMSYNWTLKKIIKLWVLLWLQLPTHFVPAIYYKASLGGICTAPS